MSLNSFEQEEKEGRIIQTSGSGGATLYRYGPPVLKKNHLEPQTADKGDVTGLILKLLDMFLAPGVANNTNDG